MLTVKFRPDVEPHIRTLERLRSEGATWWTLLEAYESARRDLDTWQEATVEFEAYAPRASGIQGGRLRTMPAQIDEAKRLSRTHAVPLEDILLEDHEAFEMGLNLVQMAFDEIDEREFLNVLLGMRDGKHSYEEVSKMCRRAERRTRASVLKERAGG